MDRGAWWATVHGIAKSQTCTHRHVIIPRKLENILLTVILRFGGGGCAGSLLLCRLFSVVMSMDYSPVVVCRPLLVVHSLVVEHGL